MPSLPFSAAASVALLVLVASDRLVADLVHHWSLNQRSGPVSTGTTGTDPTSGSSLPLSTIRLDGEQAAFTYDLPPKAVRRPSPAQNRRELHFSARK
jgi:hypothetical protein